MFFTERTSRRSGRAWIPAAALLFGLQVIALQAAAAESPADVTVREDHGVYTVTARFDVAQTPSVAWAVLTDYEQIPRFMPDVRTSVVRERLTGRAVVEQEAASGFMMFTKRVHLILEISERPDLLVFRDLCGRSFARYEGSWRVSEEKQGTIVRYELIAQPSFDVPGFMLTRLLRRDSARMIEGLRREIAARAAQNLQERRRP